MKTMRMIAVVAAGLCMGFSLSACKKDFGKPGDGGGGSGAELETALLCLKLRACFADPRPLSACILLEASGNTSVSPLLRPQRDPDGEPHELVLGVDWWERFLTARHDCIERSTTCDDARLCGNSDVDGDGAPDSCDLETLAPICRTDRLQGCYGESFSASWFEIDCTLPGLGCLPNVEAGAACGIEGCIVGPPDPVCDGEALVACQDGIIQRTECGQMGRTCGEGLEGELGCRGHGEACTDEPVASDDWVYPMAPATCDGNVASFCDNGALTTIDCAATSMMRSCTEGAPGGCTPPGGGGDGDTDTDADSDADGDADTGCNPRSFVGECDGTRVQYCVNGTVATIECAENGWTSCAMVEGAPGCQ